MLAMLVVSSPARGLLAAPPVLELPIQCQPGVDCYIQNYVDHDSGPGWRDYAGGSLSTDGHGGTDFALVDQRAMHAGVNILAASSGTVTATHDGEVNLSVSRPRTVDAAHGAAGHFVRIRHDDGWETQYSHMKRGSIGVHPGQRVEAGSVLGQVGMSGKSEFPHVHFSVRHRGRTIDPFAPTAHGIGVGKQSLWAPTVANQLAYRPTGLLGAGFAPEIPSRDKVEAGDYASITLSPDSPSMAFWIVVFGLQQDDSVEMYLTDMNGLVSGERRKVEQNNAMLFAFTGKHRVGAVWPKGRYTGRAVLRRGVHSVIDETRTMEMP